MTRVVLLGPPGEQGAPHLVVWNNRGYSEGTSGLVCLAEVHL